MSLNAVSCQTPDTEQIENEETSNNGSMKIKVTINGKVLTATLEDNPTAKDFISLLPITLNLEDYNKTEKISTLPQKLDSKEVPHYPKAVTGDIGYYIPWGNICIFYKDFPHCSSLIKIGSFDGDVSDFQVAGDIRDVKIEVFED